MKVDNTNFSSNSAIATLIQRNIRPLQPSQEVEVSNESTYKEKGALVDVSG